MLERADRALEHEEFAEAARLYQRALDHDLTNQFRNRSLRGLATALDLAGKSPRALAAYERLETELAEGPERERIGVRIVRLLVYLEKYEAAEVRARRAREDGLEPLERVALLAARALGALAHDDEESARRAVSAGLSILDPLGVEHLDRLPRDVAALAFARGELRRREAERVTFDPLPPNFGEVLERRCALLLEAQAAYSDAMRSADVHYGAMAGVRVGELYEALHHDLLTMPAPPAADTSARKQLVEGALRLRYAVLLDKAEAMMKSTLGFVERARGSSRWTERARETLTRIETARIAEERALAALPYSRSELEAALRDLEAKAKDAAAPKKR